MSMHESCSSSTYSRPLGYPSVERPVGYPSVETMEMDESCCSSTYSRPLGYPPVEWLAGYPSVETMDMDESCSSSTYSRPLGYPLVERPVGYPTVEAMDMVSNTSVERPVGYPSVEIKDMVSSARSYSYSRFGDDASIPETGWDHGDFSPKENRPYMVKWKSGKKVDQRLLVVLESYFQELYVKRNEFFKKIFPELYDQFADVFKKISAMLSNNNNRSKYQTMQRSFSFGSPRSSEIRNEKFKVKAPDVIIAQPAGGGDRGTTSN